MEASPLAPGLTALWDLSVGPIGQADPVEDIAEELLPGPVFAVARDHLRRARASRSRINTLWNSMRDDNSFSAWIESPELLVRELWCSFNPSPALQREADEAMADFLRHIKAALDACVLATANAVCRPIGLVNPELHQMPLFDTASDFDSLHSQGKLPGLRPDQIRALRLLQPFTERLEPTSKRTIARNMAHVAAGLEALRSWETYGAKRPLFTAWASEADPRPDLPAGVRVERTEIDPAGPLGQPKRLARFTLGEDSATASFAGDPNVSFDVIMDVRPWPDDPDDNFSHRSNGLLVITRHLIEGLERSVGGHFRVDLLRALDQNLPAERTDTWLPVKFSNDVEHSEARTAIAESERGMATYLNDDGTLVYLRLSEAGNIKGREIAPARVLGSSPDGTVVENAVRAAAGRWGLPDLVLRPKVSMKGNGIRELGDGTILAGSRGISLQVKARGVTGDTSERAMKWMLKNAAHGLRQARGTIRTALQDPSVELTNLRGRPVTIRASSVAWIPVVVIDHPNPPPTGVIPASDPKGPCVVMTRRDWEFLWDQLRSATAIVDYIHRVAREDPIELGAESDRYLDLAEKDATAPPDKWPDWISATEVLHISSPRLPHDPAGSADLFGHAIFQGILEDIANTDFTGEEADRVMLLSQIDRVPVAARAELGRILLRRLIRCAESSPSAHRMEHRIMYIDHGALQLTFTTMSQLTGYHREIYRSWLLLRRQDFLAKSEALGPVYPWTVGVLLTPRPDAPRPWDTTTLATNGPPAYDAADYGRLTELHRPISDTPHPLEPTRAERH